MINKTNFIFLLGSLSCLLLLLSSCSTSKKMKSTSVEINTPTIAIKKSSGGSSGMEQLNDSTYLVVYDVKNFKKGVRLAMVVLTEKSINVFPIKVDTWGIEGISSDLESICAIPGKENEFLIAESGNWKGNLGRIFHIQVDLSTRKATLLGSVKFPLLYRNDMDTTGDQYEAIHCLAYSENERIVILGERGGSKNNPTGVLRWGLYNTEQHTLNIEGQGLKGIAIDAPGNWQNKVQKRSITDMYIDANGIIWASASEDQGDAGPFYSVIYKLGKINPMNLQNPVTPFDSLTIGREIYGFKIEALSGPQKEINCTHTFGTEDEIYGGVLRPLFIASDH